MQRVKNKVADKANNQTIGATCGSSC